MFSIDTQSDASSWEQVTNLDGVDYTLRFHHSQREDAYYLSVLTGETTVSPTKKIVCNYPLFSTKTGFLFCASSDATEATPRFGELGIGLRCQLVFAKFSDV